MKPEFEKELGMQQSLGRGLRLMGKAIKMRWHILGWGWGVIQQRAPSWKGVVGTEAEKRRLVPNYRGS